MFTEENFSKLCDAQGITIQSLMKFVPDFRLANPLQIISNDFGKLQDERVLLEVAYFNGL